MHIPVFLCIGTIEYQNVNNDHTDTLLPRKELPWRHNQTRAHLEAQRFSALEVGIVSNCMPFCSSYIQEYRYQSLLKSTYI